MAIFEADLLQKAKDYSVLLENENIKLANSSNFSKKKRIFLCHSHKDESLVRGLIVGFKEQGIDLYVDWKDHSMPEKPNKKTAQKIQDRIKMADGFLFFATENSKASRWCPWEIGYADSFGKRVLILPITSGGVSFGNEYLDLYSRVDMMSVFSAVGLNKKYGVFDPHASIGTVLSPNMF